MTQFHICPGCGYLWKVNMAECVGAEKGLSAPTVPPREPTQEMVNAGEKTWEEGPNNDREMLRWIWRAMYDAAIDAALGAKQEGAT